MSLVSDLIAIVGSESLQGIIAIIVTGLLGKISWDSYRSKDVVRKSHVDEHIKKINEEVKEELNRAVNDLRSELSEAKVELEKFSEKMVHELNDSKKELKKISESAISEMKNEIKKSSSKMTSIVEKMESVETRFNSLEESSSGLISRIEEVVISNDKPRLSRAEIRKIKENQ